MCCTTYFPCLCDRPIATPLLSKINPLKCVPSNDFGFLIVNGLAMMSSVSFLRFSTKHLRSFTFALVSAVISRYSAISLLASAASLSALTRLSLAANSGE